MRCLGSDHPSIQNTCPASAMYVMSEIFVNHSLQVRPIRKVILGAVGLTIVIATSLLVEIPGDSLVSNEFQNALHTLAFSLITLVTLTVLHPRTMKTPCGEWTADLRVHSRVGSLSLNAHNG